MIPLLLLLAQAVYPVDLRVTPTTTGARLRLSVEDPRRHATVRRFTIAHERPMHLFIVSADLEFFTLEHPEEQPDGVFMADVVLPRPGPYMAVAEFVPEGSAPQVFQQMFTTGEAFGRTAAPPVDVAPKFVDGARVSVDASQLSPGGARPLVVRIDNPSTGAPLADLEPYLGAAAHLFIVTTDLTDVVHVHTDERFTDPGLTFTPLVPRAGRYKLWVRWQRGGHVSVASFVVDVSAPPA